MVKSAGGERKVRLARGEKRNKKRMSTVGAVFTQKPNIRTPEAVVESLFAESSKPHPTKRYHRPEQKLSKSTLASATICSAVRFERFTPRASASSSIASSKGPLTAALTRRRWIS